MSLLSTIVGEYVINEGRTLLVKEDKELTCKGCVFENGGCKNECLGAFRIDNTDVIFEQVDI